MELNSYQNMLNRKKITQVQSYQNSHIHQSPVNYGSQRIFPNTELSQSVNLLNNIIPTQLKKNNELMGLSDYRNDYLNINKSNSDVGYYNHSNQYLSSNQNNTIITPQNQIYRGNIIKTTYTAPTIRTMKVLPTIHLPTEVIEGNQTFNINKFAKVFPLNDYYNNLNTVSNTQIIQQPPLEYFPNNTTNSYVQPIKPINNVITNNYIASVKKIAPVDKVKSIANLTPTTPIINISNSTEEYKTTKSQTQVQEVSKPLNYGLENMNANEDVNININKNDENLINNENINNEYLINDYVEIPPEKVSNIEVLNENENKKINKEYYENSPIHEKPNESAPHAFIYHSPILVKKVDKLSPIQTPLSNNETQSYNQENTLYKLENELLTLKAENESYKKQIQELYKYKSEADEAKALKEQVEHLSPPKEQFEEMASLKTQLAELNELKLKVQELEKLRVQMEQMTSNTKKKRKFKSPRKKKKRTKIYEKKNELNENPESQKEPKEPEEKNIDVENNKNMVLKEKTEQTFENGDLIHNIEELKLIIGKINKESKKMTLNLIYKEKADSYKSDDFKNKCEKAKNTLVLIETDKGERFGGYHLILYLNNYFLSNPNPQSPIPIHFLK